MSALQLPKSPHTLYLVDISSFIFRAFFAIRALKSKSGEPTNAVYGVATMLAKLAEDAKPDYLAVVYDSKGPSFRKEIYPEYKAHRTEAPDDLKPQFARVEQLVSSFEMHSYRQNGIEADDLIATLTDRWCHASPKNQVVVVSGDKDLMQLVDDRVCLWDTMSNTVYGPEQVKGKFGVTPEQIRDYLALVGDSSDNIPGVAGIGPKGAADLLRDFGSLEAILSAAQAGSIPGKKGETLRTQEKEARLSAELATLRRDLQTDIPLESLQYHFHITPECEVLFNELGFHQLLARWKGEAQQSLGIPAPMAATATSNTPKGDEAPAGRFRTINTEPEFQSLLESLHASTEFGFDLETTSLNPREAQIVGIAVSYDLDHGYYIPIGHQAQVDGTSIPQLPRTRVYEGLRPLIEGSRWKKIGQNLKYDWSVLRESGFNPDGIGADTMIAAYLLDPNGRHNLTALAASYLDYAVQTYEQVCGKGKDAITFDQVSIADATRYSAEDAWISLKLWKNLEPRLDTDLMSIFNQVDLPLVQVLSRMELQGVTIDVPWLKALSKQFEGELHAIETRVQAYALKPINLNSPKQLATLLFEDLKLPTQYKTKTGFSTDASVLETLAPLHEVPQLLLEYREIAKLKGTYVDPLPELRDAKTGRIHASFHQTVAATGRLSSSDPNLQNIPIRTERGMKIRRAFIPSEGNLLVAADYSQIELRLLAHMSGDPELSRSFQKDEDIHRRTASEIFSIPPENVDDTQRGIAKAINFGLMYGKTVFGLSQELKIPRKDAKEMIDRYFERYRGVKEFLDSQIRHARETGYVSTLMGRKRALPDIHSKNAAIRSNAERMAMNSPIQGTAADLIKLAMIELDRRLESGGYRSKVIIQVHDEIVLDCPRDEVETMKNLVTEVMENAMTLSVPLKVNAASGENWAEL